ncbi:helix-turn-helix transcriptional regulator [Agrobacterium sp. NPDC090273]|uniref:helix-turn-helix transcriptional regulator n=1 Tax=Agrobacterium sp. NPDC090273 TaxID=3363919 RepID=UPI00383BC49C
MRAARALLGISQEELAACSGVSRQIVARMERGEENITADSIMIVRRALEANGIVFLPSNKERGPAVAERRSVQSAAVLPTVSSE